MAGRYQTYPKYIESDVDILGIIPAHWNVMQLKRTVEGCVNGIWGTEPNNDGDDTIVLRVADFDRSKLTINNDGYTYRRIEQKEKLKRLLKPGDLLLEKSGGGEKTLVGQVVLFDKLFESVTSNFVAKMTPKEEFESRFLNYVFSRFYEAKINYCSIKQNTGIQNLDSESYLIEKFGFPPIHEQSQIANFLDHETAKIDTLIEKQQQLIKLLKEKRQAVISHAVTKGLNPNAPMRDSGVEWLGEVPEHWIVGKVAYCSSSLDQCRVPIEAGVRGDRQGEYLYYGASGIIDYVDDYLFDEPLVLVCEDGWNLMLRSQPVARPVNGKIWVNNHAHILRADVVEPSLLAECIEQTPLHLFVTGMRQPKLTADALRNIPVAYPPEKDEQMQLVQYMRKVVSKFSLLESRAKDSIELLKERRSALISAAVTGKIDVRNWKAPEQSQANQEAAA